ncbi:uncharacterized protein LOC142335351 [Convolutriloba macropyga]|uniref:uncharacterized protein LOC142335351 n=1 Tax=Convolutriloba macropyga TaxID=536237 RepID=UPI003F523E14
MSFIWDETIRESDDEENEEEYEMTEDPRRARNQSKGKFGWGQAKKQTQPSEHNAKSENSSSDSMEDITVPIVTNELEPSLWTKVFRLIRNIILFPTKITVILGIASFIWLLCCASWIGYGLTNDHYCPADPRIPQIIAWHGILWVGFSAYIIVRLIWVEINASRSPTCSCLVGNPDVSLTWPKELTYALDTVLFSIIVTCYVVQFILIVGLTRSGAIFYTATTKDWPTCHNCCVKSVVQFGASQMFISYIGLLVVMMFYLYALGWLESIRRRLCHCDIAQTSEEATRLV